MSILLPRLVLPTPKSPPQPPEGILISTPWRHAAKRRAHTPNTKDNFEFDRVIPLRVSLALVGLGLFLGYLFFGDNAKTDRSQLQNTPGFGGVSQSIALKSWILLGSLCVRVELAAIVWTFVTAIIKNGALEPKGFIAQKLRESHKKPHILEMLVEAYPALKSNRVTTKIDVPSFN